mmetsp:Transcript_3443/g.8296  ORF Transcript_3443/g.8296 Transcript_3443/m.8296 type:complete len:213 (+) Transcript_3443:159-797(+)
MNTGNGGALLSTMISSPNSKLWVRCEPSIYIRPRCEFQRMCISSSAFMNPLSTLWSMTSFEFSIMCSRIMNCRSEDSKSIGWPPAAAMAAVDPVLVAIHIPEDHTFNPCLMSYDIPAKRVPASFGTDGTSPSTSISESNFDNQPRRNRDTAPGLGFAINKSFSAGTRRVSEKVDLTLQRMRVRFESLSSFSPNKIGGMLSFRSSAVHAQSAP